MCIGIPMRVKTVQPGRATCSGRAGERIVSTALVGGCEPGEWLLVFLDAARERIRADRAAEIDAALDLLEHAMSADASARGKAAAAPGFALPSAMSAEQLAAVVGQAATNKGGLMPADSTTPATAPSRTSPATVSSAITRLIDDYGARWVDEASVDAWCDEPGTAVLLIAGDPVRFPEATDVATVLPELQLCSPTPFRIAIARPDSEDALARRYGAQRRPVLVCCRDGGYLSELSGMFDWADFVRELAAVLALPVSKPRAAIGIPVVAAPDCH